MNLKILKNSNFSNYITSLGTSLFGTLFLNTGLALYVLKMTGSVKIFSSVLILGVFPHIILGPFAGALADRFDKKKWVIFFDIMRGLLCVALGIVAYYGPLTLPLIYFVILFISSCDILFNPVFASLLPTIVKPEDRVDANSTVKAISEVIKVTAPFLSTVVFSQAGIVPIMIVDAFTFFISGWALYKVAFAKTQKKSTTEGFFSSILGGFQVYVGNKRLASVVGNAFLTHCFIFPFYWLGFPYLIITVLKGAETSYGIVESIASMGAIASMFFIAKMKHKSVASNIWLGIVGMCFPVMIMLFLSNDKFKNYLMSNDLNIILFFGIVSFTLFLSFTFYVVFFATFYQGEVPQEKFGRFAASVMFSNAIGRLIGFTAYGFLLDYSIFYSILVLVAGMILKLLVHIPFMTETKRLTSVQQEV